MKEFHRKLSPNLAFVLCAFTSLLVIKLVAGAVTMTSTANTYSAYKGSSVVMSCTGTEMNMIDIVWTYTDNLNTIKRIYFEENLEITSGKYTVETKQTAVFGVVTSSLSVNNIDSTDATHTYTCSCNPFRRCSQTPASVSMSILAMDTTTTTTTSTTTTTTTTTEALCKNGNYNTAQFVLVVISIGIMIAATILFHLSFHAFKESLMETFFMAFAIVLCVFCLIVGVVFWVNPTSVGLDSIVSPIVVVTSMVGGCVVLWILVIQYSVRLCMGDELKLGIVILVCIDALFEAVSGALVIASNVYCGGLSSFPALSGFNYSFLELIGATFLLIFAFALLLIAGVVFFMKKKKNDEHVLNSFKALVSGSPLTPANFGYMAKSSQGQRPPALIQELWFPSKKVVPINEFQPDEFNRDIMPPKPKKLTPIFSKKRSEIMQQTGIEVTEPVKKPKKPKANKEEAITATYSTSDVAQESTTPKKKSKKKVAKDLELTSAREEADFATYDTEQEKAKNKFATIWDADQLAPKVGDGQLGTIGEEFAPLKITRTKSYLGGKVAKLDEEHINNLSNVQDVTKPITYKKASSSANKNIMSSNESAVLVDEFNKAQSSSSSIGN